MLPSRCPSIGRLALRRAAHRFAAASSGSSGPRPRPSSSGARDDGGYDLPPLDLAAVLRSSPPAAAAGADGSGVDGGGSDDRPKRDDLPAGPGESAEEGAGGPGGDAEARETLARVREMISSGDGVESRPAAGRRRKRPGSRRRGRRGRGGGTGGASFREAGDVAGPDVAGLDLDGTSSPARGPAGSADPGTFPRGGEDGDVPCAAVPDFSAGPVATQADGTSFCRSGGTAVLAAVTLTPHEGGAGADGARGLFLDSTRRENVRLGGEVLPLAVDFRSRHHAVGRLPPNRRLSDNAGPMTDAEALAARAVDRALRPWIASGLAGGDGERPTGRLPGGIDVRVSVQEYDPLPGDGTGHADPVALAVNASFAAVRRALAGSGMSPGDPAGCVRVAMRNDGTYALDPDPAELEGCVFDLLYAGTTARKGGERVLMAEGGARERRGGGGERAAVTEEAVTGAFVLAMRSVRPVAEGMDRAARGAEAGGTGEDDGDFRALLGVSPDPVGPRPGPPAFGEADASSLREWAASLAWGRLGRAALSLFGEDDPGKKQRRAGEGGPGGEGRPDGDGGEDPASAEVHTGGPLLSKAAKGRRERLVRDEVGRILPGLPLESDVAGPPPSAAEADARRSILGDAECLRSLTTYVHETVMRRAMDECAGLDLRSDGRAGRGVVRPVGCTVPALGDAVHGSAVFSRGETQVLCTATLGPPREGRRTADPLADAASGRVPAAADREGDEDGPDEAPVGSLRFLRGQVALESDMNSRRVRAGVEMTGDSGSLAEARRLHLQYDFPSYATGEAGRTGSRRAVGHGALAERAILPVLPSRDAFPYAIRLTGEVTSSNGSSSMATVSGCTLALLDAGVDLPGGPVAGVSVGLAPGLEGSRLLLDITGTEDHYGAMDFKVAGTADEVTALQLDVKRPLPMSVLHRALGLAREGRVAILRAMEEQCEDSLGGLRPRGTMKSRHRMAVIKFDPNRRRDLIGPGGSVLRQLEDRFLVELDLTQEGRCLLYGETSSVERAKGVIQDLVCDVEPGEVYRGTIIEVKDFGLVVEILRNKEGLLHISEMKGSEFRIGDTIEVVATKVDHASNKIKLSLKDNI